MIVSILEVSKLSLRAVEKYRMMPSIASWLSDFMHVCCVLLTVPERTQELVHPASQSLNWIIPLNMAAAVEGITRGQCAFMEKGPKGKMAEHAFCLCF